MNRYIASHGSRSRASAVRLACLAGALCIFDPASASGLGPRPLGLAEAAELAVQQQPQLQAQQAAVTALSEAAPAAAQLPDPTLRMGLLSVPVDSLSFTRESMTEASIGISQMIPGGSKRSLASARLEREAAQGSQTLAAIARRIARDAQLAWLDLYGAGAARDLIRQVEAEYRRQLEWSEVAYKAGKLTQEETLALRGMLESTRDRDAEIARQHARAQAALGRWIGADAQRPLAAPPDASAPAPLAGLLDSLPRHPELAAFDAAVAVARSDVALAREAYKPDWSVDLSYGLRGDNRVDLVSLVVGVDLPVLPAKRQDRRLASQLAGLEQAEQIRLDRYPSLRAELEAAYADWQSAEARVVHYEQAILPLARRRVESALAAYGSDRASYGQVLEARRAEVEARLQWLAQRVARARGQAQLDYFRAP